MACSGISIGDISNIVFTLFGLRGHKKKHSKFGFEIRSIPKHLYSLGFNYLALSPSLSLYMCLFYA